MRQMPLGRKNRSGDNSTNAQKISHDGGCPSLNNTSGGSMVRITEVTPGQNRPTPSPRNIIRPVV